MIYHSCSIKSYKRWEWCSMHSFGKQMVETQSRVCLFFKIVLENTINCHFWKLFLKTATRQVLNIHYLHCKSILPVRWGWMNVLIPSFFCSFFFSLFFSFPFSQILINIYLFTEKQLLGYVLKVFWQQFYG